MRGWMGKDQLKSLYDEGITITLSGKKYKIRFILAGILGDNLGVNTLLGLKESFSATNYCRFCTIPKSEAHYF